MKFPRTAHLITGRPSAAPWLCVLLPLAFAGIFHEFLVLPRGLRLALPAVDAPVAIGAGERVFVVAVDANERLYFENQLIELRALGAALNARAAVPDAPRVLLLQADKAVRAAKLGELAALARNAGLRDIVLATRPARP
jgi:biopolymer transport protein ExbD